MDEFNISLVAGLDSTKSKENINRDIDRLKSTLDELLLQAKIDPKQVEKLEGQLDSIKVKLNDAQFTQSALDNLVKQINTALSGIKIGNINVGSQAQQVGQQIGNVISQGIQQNIDSGVVADIKKISDASTSAIVQNEKKKQEAYRATTETVMYHAGVVSKLNKAETNGRFYGSNRGTGYFGTGHYFVDSATKHELDNNSSYSKLPYTSIDISKYDNLFKANTDEIANRLHSFLRNLTKFTQGSDANSVSELFSQFKKVFGDTVMDMQEFDAKLEQLKSFMQNSNMSDRSDSVSTQFMKSLGYGGVDTRGTKYADTRYGTVIYDLKEESVLQANITDELQKQGQMLEKINYEKGQVFDKTEDSRIQSIIDQQAKSKEIETEFDKLFDSTKIKAYESELDSVNETLKKNDDIISDCQYTINNADEAVKKFAKDMANLGIEMSEDEIKSQADDYRVSYQERIDELEKERPLLESRKKQLEENLNAEYELANVAREQARQIVDERHKEVQSVQEVSDKIKSFSELKIKSNDFVNIDGLTKAEDILEKVRTKYEQFGQVTFKNIELDADGNLKSFRVNIQQTNGDLKETRNFLMEISDDAKKVKFSNDTIKGTENVVRHLNEQKDATDEIIKEEQKLANAMADVREKSEQTRQAEEKRQELAQNNAINKALEEEYIQKQKIIAQEEKLAQATAEKANKIQLSFANGNYEAKVESTIAKTQQWRDENGNARISTEQLRTALVNLGTAYNNLNADGGNTIANQEVLKQAESELSAEIKRVTNEVAKMNAEYAKSSKVESLHQKLTEFYDKNSATHKKWGTELKQMMDATASGAKVTNSELLKMELRYKEIGNEARQAGKLGLSLFDGIKEQAKKFTQWVSITSVVMKGVQAVRGAVGNVIELDDALLELSKVSDLSAEGLENVTNQAYELGEKVARTGKEVIDATTEFKRAGFDMQQSMDMAESAMVMTNVAENITDTADAAGTLISVLKGFNMDASETMTIVDKINQVSNTSPIGFDNIAEGLERTAGTMAQSGNTIDQTIGLITAGYAQLRNVEKVSTGLVTLSARLRGVGEDGEVIDGLSSKLQEDFGKIGVAIENADGSLRSIYEIVQDYSKVLPTLTDKQKQYYAELAAGKRQVTVWNAITQQFQDAENAVSQSLNSQNSALDENQKKLDSIGGHVKSFESAMEHLSSTVVDSDLVKFFVDLGTTGVKAIDGLVNSLTPLGTLSAGIGLFAGIKNVGISMLVAY